MAYSSTYGLISVMTSGGWHKLPLDCIKYSTYKSTPDQRLDQDSTRNTSGLLIRNVLPHRATKIEFQTRPMNSTMKAAFMSKIRDAWAAGSEAERRLRIKYWDDETDAYKEGTFYTPDIDWSIKSIDEAAGRIDYDSTTIKFIEY